MLVQLERVIAAIIESPDTRLVDVDVLGDAERAQLEAWNRTHAPELVSHTFIERFDERAARAPSNVAVEHGDRSATYGELAAASRRYAAALEAAGAAHGDRILLALPRGIPYLTAVLACFRLGAAFVPMDTSHPQQRNAMIATSAKPTVVVTNDSEAAARVLATSGLADVALVSVETAEQSSPIAGPPRAALEDAAYVLFTSGSTGTPKGAIVPHRGLVNALYAKAQSVELREGDRVAQTATHLFDISVWQLLVALHVGGRVRIYDDRIALDSVRLLEAVVRDDVRVMQAVPALFRGIVDELERARPALPLRYVVCAGEALPPDLVRRWLAVVPHVPVINAYGPTECSIDMTHAVLAAPPAADVTRVSIGKRLANYRLFVLDGRREHLPIGTIGELYASGAGVGLGYLDDAQRTSEVFVPNPYEPGNVMYRTGDLASFREDGSLDFYGRMDQQVKIRGNRIETGEVRAALLKHSGVRDAEVLTAPRGGEHLLVAYLVADDAVTTAALKQHLAALLPDYMVPSSFILLESFPLTTSGKVDRKSLPQPLFDAPPATARTVAAPLPGTESLLAEIWATLLSVPHISRTDNFFELGGDSVLAIQVSSAARARGVGITPRQIFENQTLAELAASAEVLAVTGAKEDSAATTGEVPLTPIQAWFFAQKLTDAKHYNQALLLDAPDDVSVPDLTRALAAVIAHHDALRLRFSVGSEGVRQHHATVEEVEGTSSVKMVDLSRLQGERLERAHAKALAAAHETLDLAAGPLLQAVLLHHGTRHAPQLLLVAHHLVIDAVSWRIIVADLERAYEASRSGAAIVLPPKTSSYKSWATRLAAQTRDVEHLEREVAAWLALPWGDARELLVDHAGGANVEDSVDTVSFELGAEETRTLLRGAPRAYGANPSDVLLTALAGLFAHQSGTSRVVVDVEHHGRDALGSDLDVSRTVGWFTSIHPVLLTWREGAPVAEAIKTTKEDLRRFPAGGAAFGLARLAGLPSLAELPQARVCFNYLGVVDVGGETSSTFSLGKGDSGRARGASNVRPHLVDVTAAVRGGRLTVEMAYSRNVHTRRRIEGWVEQFGLVLRDLIAHLAIPAHSGYTPSDFPTARLDQDQIDAIAPRRGSIEDIYPLTPIQQGFWLFSQYAEKEAVGVEQTLYTLTGALDLDVLADAWNAVVDTHPVLRTTFRSVGQADPVQIVLPPRSVTVPIACTDLRHLSDEEQAAAVARSVSEDRAASFDLATGPLVRVSVFQLGDERWRVLWSHHHLILDGWSVPLVLRDVALAYAQARDGLGVSLLSARPFREYVRWLGRLDKAAGRAAAERLLGDVERATPLVVDRLGDGSAPEGRAEAHGVLTAEVTSKLGALARRTRVTLGTVLTAAWSLLLSRYSGERDIVFGVTVAGRPDLPDVENMIGLFINVVPTRVSIDETLDVAEFLKRISARQIEERAYEHMPLIDLQSVTRVPATQPLFQSLLVFENYPMRASDLERASPTGLAVSEIEAPVHTRYPITLVVEPGAQLALRVWYDRRWITGEVAERLLGHLTTLLAGLDGATKLAELPLLTQAEATSTAALVIDGSGRRVPNGIVGFLADEPSCRARVAATGRVDRLGLVGEELAMPGTIVYPQEIALALARHPSVSEARVSKHVDSQGVSTLVAHFVRREGVNHVAPLELRRFLRTTLPDGWVPTAYVAVDELSPESMRPPEVAEHAFGGTTYVAPRSPVERALSEIWGELTELGAVGIHDNFYDIGGQSLLTMRMTSRIRERLGVDIGARALFEAPTIAQLAPIVEKRIAERESGNAAASSDPFVRMPLRKRPLRQRYELASNQLAEFYFYEMDPTSPMYNVLSADVLFVGDLDVDVIVDAWNLILKRHPILTLRFAYAEGRPVQELRPDFKIARSDIYRDFTHLPEADYEAETEKLAHEFASHSFNFFEGPMFKFMVAEFTGNRFVMMCLINHINWDEISQINLSAELREIYTAVKEGREAHLPEVSVDYLDYHLWLEEALENGTLEPERQFWLDAYKTQPPHLELPTDFPYPQQLTFAGSDVEEDLDPETKRALYSFTVANPQVTLSMVLHSALTLFLYRLTGQRDIAVGVPNVNRGDRRLETLIGPFANALPMRTHLDRGLTFAELLEQNRAFTMRALEHYAYPTTRLIRELNPEWDPSRTRLYTVMFGVQHKKTKFWSEMRLPGMETYRQKHLRRIGPLHSTSRSDFRFMFEEIDNEVLFSLSYNSDLFKRSTVERLATQFRHLIRQVTANPNRELDDYVLASAEEQALLASGFAEAGPLATLPTSMASAWNAELARRPNATALRHGRDSWTMAQLNIEANRIANALASAGIGLEDRVGLLLEPSLPMIASILACIKLGAAIVPLLPEELEGRNAEALELANPAVLIGTRATRPEALGFRGDVWHLDTMDLTLYADTDPPDHVRPKSSLAVFFTSGSTGKPKGIEIEHVGMLDEIESLRRVHPNLEGETTLFTTPYNIDIALMDIFWPLLHGGTVLIPEGAEAKQVTEIARLIEEHRIPLLQSVPVMLTRLVELRQSGKIGPLPSMVTVMVGTEVMTRELATQFGACFGATLYNLYGTTEVTADATRHDARTPTVWDVVPIGKPVHGTRIYVVDEHLRPVPIGVRGEICIACKGVSRGYIGDTGLTAAKFVPDPFSLEPGARMYRTGDLGRFDSNGDLHFLGRIDRQVKVRGFRVELEAVESRIGLHPAVERCAVRQEKGRRSVDDLLIAYVEPKQTSCAARFGEGTARVVSVAQCPVLRRDMDALNLETWPGYFAGSPTYKEYWPRLFSQFGAFQLLALGDEGEVMVIGHSIPIHWDGTVDALPEGWDGAMARAFAPDAPPPNTLCILAAVVAPGVKSKGLSTDMLTTFKRIARAHGLSHVLAPVRPTGKSARPDLSFSDYCELRRDDGTTEDRWIRVHERLGAKRLRVDDHSQLCEGTLEDWKRWTGRELQAGSHDLPDTLAKTVVDPSRDLATYYDPCLWMEHPLEVDESPLTLVDARTLKDFVAETMPPYMVPDLVIIRPHLPVNAGGKLDLVALGKLDLGDAAPTPPPKAPSTPLEATLLELLRGTLGEREVGVNSDFFTSGGNSLAAIELLAKIVIRLGVKVKMRDFLARPTVEGLAHHVDRANAAAASTVEERA